jgi:hypothetical protein
MNPFKLRGEACAAAVCSAKRCRPTGLNAEFISIREF